MRDFRGGKMSKGSDPSVQQCHSQEEIKDTADLFGLMKHLKSCYSDFLSTSCEWFESLSTHCDHIYNRVLLELKPEVGEGPHLFSLPGNLLQEIENQLKQCSVLCGSCISSAAVENARLCVDALSIICRNFDNIPFVSSCDVLYHIIVIASSIVQQIYENDIDNRCIDVDLASSFLKSVLYFLECLYDPYFMWRSYCLNKTINEDILFPPAVLHVEVVPFFYDCFQKKNCVLPPAIQVNILHLFGAIISGAKHNAVTAITPATLEVLYKVLSDTAICPEAKHQSTCCLVQAVNILQQCSTEERQVEVSTIIVNMMAVVADIHENLDFQTLHISCVYILSALNRIFRNKNDATIQRQFENHGYCLSLLHLLETSKLEAQKKNELTVEVIKTLTAFTSMGQQAKKHLDSNIGVEKLFHAVKNSGNPSLSVVEAVISFACDSAGVPRSVSYPSMTAFIIEWLPEMPPDIQTYAVSEIASICLQDFRSKIKCCYYGVAKSVIRVLEANENLAGRTVGHLMRLLRILAIHSITSVELKQLFYLLRPDENGKQFGYLLPLLHNLSLVSKKSEMSRVHHFIDLAERGHGISFGSIQKWPGTSFSFHAWLQLDRELPFRTSEKVLQRRQLYCITNSFGGGFEAFFNDKSELAVVTRTKKEYHAAVAKGCPLSDGRWHSVDICYTPGRRPFTFSIVNVYIDHSLQLSSQLKFPSLTESFTHCNIGSGGKFPEFHNILSSPDNSESSVYNTLANIGSQAVGQISSYIDRDRLFSLAPNLTLSNAIKNALQASPDPTIQTCHLGTQDSMWGIPSCLFGRLASVCIFSDTLHPTQLKILQSAGASSLTLFQAEEGPEFELSAKLVLRYDAKAVAGSDCIDLANQHLYPGEFSGYHHSVHSVKDVLNTIGGLPVLYPLIENAGKPIKSMSTEFCESPPVDNKTSIVSETEDWVVVDNNTSENWFVTENQVAACLLLICDMLRGHSENQEQLSGKHGIAIVGALMERTPANLIEVNVLMAVQQLCKDVEASGNLNLLSAVQESVLFNFKIWSRGNFAVRIGHIQYVTSVIKGDRKRYRRKHGVQFLLNVISTFYSDCDLLSSDDMRTVRMSLLGIVKFYISRDANIEEVSAIIGFLIITNQEEMVIECLDVLLSVLENPSTRDQLFLLLYEPGYGELLYCLLFNPDFSDVLKVKVLKVIRALLNTDKVYEKSKTRLKLHDVGFSCLTQLLPVHQISEEMISLLVDQCLMSDNMVSYQGMLALLTVVHKMPLSVKIEIAGKFGEVLNSRPKACSSVVKNAGWQECIMGLLVKNAITGLPSSCSQFPGLDLIDLSADLDSQEGKSSGSEAHSDSPGLHAAALRRLSHLSSQLSLEDGLPRTPQLLLQLKEHIFDFDIPQLLSRTKSESRSPSDDDPEVDQSDKKSISPEQFECGVSSGSIYKDFCEVENQEQVLCELVCHLAHLLLWKGVEGSGKQAWFERGQVFAAINMLALSNELFGSHLEVKRKLLEKMLHACLSDLQEAAHANATHTENAMEIMKLVYDTVVLEKVKDERTLSEQLLEEVLSLLDVMLVFEESPGEEGWPEMAQMGLDILLVCAASKNLVLCAMATARLHCLVMTRPFSSVNQACHLLVELDCITTSTIETGDQEHYSFLIPVIRALLEKLRVSLLSFSHLNALPQTSSGPIFFDEFQQYALNPEWKSFIEKVVKSYQEKYTSDFTKSIKEMMNSFWNQCYEATMVAMHKRNRETGESKLRFQSQILDVFHVKAVAEQAKYNALQTAICHQSYFVRRRWKMAKLSLFGSRGPWKMHSPPVQNWKLSHHENLSRMRLVLVLNHNFDDHKLASSLRDNQALNQQPKFGKLPPVAAEARVTELQEDSITDEDLQIIAASEMEGPDASGKEKIVISEDCELVTLMSVVKGRFEVTTTHMYFFDLSPVKDEVERQDFKCTLSNLREIHLRRYNLRRSALEFFLIDQTNFFLNFTTQKRNKIYSRIVTLKPANLFYSQGIRSPAELLKASGLTQKWVQHEISNFDYLMQLNTIAGRTYNDLSQYPVFPWILADYTSSELDLESPSSFRDLSKPMGVVNPKNIPEVKEKYENFVDITGTVEKFHYGTHYSNSAGVVHYLVRMEPFTSLHIELQSGRFDVADRQFHSFEATWKMMMDNPNDVKELIPEFFYLPEFLKNLNGYDLGKLQGSKEKIGDVKFPKWAKSAEDFIYKHRKALESEFVSQHLHEWIDLIFGYKQKGPAAVEALNVFYYVSYEGAVDLDAIEDPAERNATEGMINNFGQTPCQLLKEPHPRRMTLAEATEKMIKADKPLNLFLFLNSLKAFFVEASSSDSPVSFITVPKPPIRSFIQHGMLETLVTVSQDGTVGVHGWLPYDKTRVIPNYFTFDRDVTLSSNKPSRRSIGLFQPGLNISSNLFAVTSDAKFLISGGHWDNSIQIHSLSKFKLHAKVIRHHGIVTCLSLDHTSSHLMTGSRDTTCMIWELGNQAGSSGSIISNTPKQILYGHDDEVSCVVIATDLDMAISSSMDGTVNIHTVREGYFIRTLYPKTNCSSKVSIIISLSQMGYLCVHCQPKKDKKPCSLHLYSINGKHLFQRETSSITSMYISGDYLVTGGTDGMLTIYETFGLQVATSLSLHIPILAVSVTPGNSHILASLRDGKLIVIGISTNTLC